MSGAIDYARIDGASITVIVSVAAEGSADLVYLGPRLGAEEDCAALDTARQRGRHENAPDIPAVAGLLPEVKYGYAGQAAVLLRDGADTMVTDFRVENFEADRLKLMIRFANTDPDIAIELHWEVGAGDVIRSRMLIENRSDMPIGVDRLAAVAIPIPERFRFLTSYSGRWAKEMQETVAAIPHHGFAACSRAGKPGFGGGNWLLLGVADEAQVMGAHLGWSGDYETFIDRDCDGRAVLVMAPALASGEVVLTPGERLETPEAVIGLAPDRSRLGQNFHHYLRFETLPDRADWGPRKVHLNSWEALGLAMDESKLMALADRAADLGIERFVLDDGWFGDRRNDRAALGDWSVSADVLPNGLGPLIAHIEARGMDFGLWVEPEMVSPDSDLYRAHPDWCLNVSGLERRTQRHQLVLDLTQRKVSDYLFETLDGLLSENRIAYLKWDHNRALFPAANAEGPVRFVQTQEFYALLDRIRAAHPRVEIESCSSGGGRIDYGVLKRCHRVWASDNNDALERLEINRSWSQFLPLEVIGSHVGPSPNPITGRRLNMDFCAKIAMFGHMGVEADPGRMDEWERKVLSAHIALYKQWRDLLHSGALYRIDHQDPGVSGLLVRGSERSLALIAQCRFAADFNCAPVRLPGFDADATYRVTLPEPWPAKASRYLADRDGWADGLVLSGRALLENGLALPLIHPETAWLVAVERIDR